MCVCVGKGGGGESKRLVEGLNPRKRSQHWQRKWIKNLAPPRDGEISEVKERVCPLDPPLNWHCPQLAVTLWFPPPPPNVTGLSKAKKWARTPHCSTSEFRSFRCSYLCIVRRHKLYRTKDGEIHYFSFLLKPTHRTLSQKKAHKWSNLVSQQLKIPTKVSPSSQQVVWHNFVDSTWYRLNKLWSHKSWNTEKLIGN